MNKLFQVMMLSFLIFFGVLYQYGLAADAESPKSSTSRFKMIMVDDIEKCEYCTAWKKEVQSQYEKSKYGKMFPLVILDLYIKEIPEWLNLNGLKKPVKKVPTFLFWDLYTNKELMRIDGYTPGESKKWMEVVDEVKEYIFIKILKYRIL